MILTLKHLINTINYLGTNYKKRHVMLWAKKTKKIWKSKYKNALKWFQNKTSRFLTTSVIRQSAIHFYNWFILIPIKFPLDSFDISITPLQLFNLIHDKSKNILILDIRPSFCYDESHIKYENCISIPEERIIAGYVKQLFDYWTMRLNRFISQNQRQFTRKRHPWIVKTLVARKGFEGFHHNLRLEQYRLHTWKTDAHSEDDFAESKYVEHMPYSVAKFNIVMYLKWDPNVIYPHSPIALGGGYENWLNTYPTLTTNPHVAPPERINDLDDFLSIYFDLYRIVLWRICF